MTEPLVRAMSVIHPGLFLILERFPSEKDNLRRMYTRSQSFQTLCDDYQKCTEALAYWRQSGQDQALESDAQAENPHPDAVNYIDLKGLDIPVQYRIGEIVIGADKGEFSIRQLCEQSVQSVVKIVVSQGGGLISHFTHQPELEFPPVKVEIRGPLEDVALVHQQDVPALLDLGVAAIFGPGTPLAEIVEFLRGIRPIMPQTTELAHLFAAARPLKDDFSEVVGQEHVKRAMEIAAAATSGKPSGMPVSAAAALLMPPSTSPGATSSGT